jgi:type IV pilus assembly protein PilC
MPTMTTYNYQVRDRSGKLVSGTLDAENAGAVASRLKQMGYAPVSIAEGNAGLSKEIKLPSLGNKVKLKDLAVFSRQFATMMNSGLSLLRALSILTEQTENKVLATVVGEVRNDVQAGSSLSASLGKHPKVFPPLMVNMTKAGEVGGFLDTVMLDIANNYEAEVKLRSKIKSAMTYPTVVLCIALIAVTAMLLFIVPTFAKMFKSLGSQLPAPTRLLVTISHIMKVGFPVIIIMFIGSIVVWNKVKNKEEVRNVIDPLKLKFPVFGPLFQKVALARFARNLSTMMKSGVPILQSLEIVADTTGNVVVSRAVRDVQESVRQGESITAPLRHHEIFPPMVAQMMAVGEDTGALDQMLSKIAQFYDDEVEATAAALTSLIEPLMIAFLGGLVGSMIIALYMPIFSIYNHIQG